MVRRRAAGAFIAVLISSALSDVARGGDLIECEPQRVTGDGRHWAYRIVDGRECWYPGRPGKPKNELSLKNGWRTRADALTVVCKNALDMTCQATAVLNLPP